MVVRAVVGSVFALVLGDAVAIQAQGLPTCHVRILKSAAVDRVPERALRQVEQWVDVPQKGVTVVSSLDMADVLLEFHDYKPKVMPEGTPAEEWWFVMRRLSEPNGRRGTYRYRVITIPDPRSHAFVAKNLPLMVVDVCLGYLPKI